MPTRAAKKAHEIDKFVGMRLKTLRLMRQKSQSDIAAVLELTFQQVQKYENGKNRLSAGRLKQLADYLGVAVQAFFTDAAGDVPSFSENYLSRFLSTADGLRLAQAVDLMDRKVRIQLVALAETVGRVHG